MTANEISDRILKRIDEDVTAPGSVVPAADGSPVPPEILAAINEAQELFVLLSLCLEATASLTLAASTTFSSLRGLFPDFLCPLRLTVGGVRVRPATLAQLDAENDAWQATAGWPLRYFSLGFSFFGVTPQPVGDTTAILTYARAPLQLVADAFPEIPEMYHQSLVKYGVYRITLKQGAQGLQRGLGYLKDFLDDAAACGDYVRARSRASRYDTLPVELKLADRAKLLPPKTKA